MGISNVSVVIPAYSGMPHLEEAIRSVLGQTYADFELIIVDDASPEALAHVVEACGDPRVKYVRHSVNKGAVAARQTGVTASSGDIIALLDQDDLFHARKLEMHVDYFARDPGVGMTFNDRVEIRGEDKRPCGLHRAPTSPQLSDWLLGFPVAPSDVVLRRDWAIKDEIWEHSAVRHRGQVVFNGQEIVFGGRLTLSGCRMGRVARALNYRRFHPHRILGHLAERWLAELACQEMIFSDPRCPVSLLALKGEATANISLMWAYAAYQQGEFDLGRQLLRHARDSYPRMFAGDPCRFLTEWLLWASTGNLGFREGADILETVFDNLPEELRDLREQRQRTIAQSRLIAGLHTLVWGRPDESEPYFKLAFDTGAVLDNVALRMAVHELLNREAEFGPGNPPTFDALIAALSRLQRHGDARRLAGLYRLNRAFHLHSEGRLDEAGDDLVRLVASDPSHLLNRGVVSMLRHALTRRVLGLFSGHTS